ncbi:LCP family glycopolymer transferase [Solibacillus sp. FSL K6-1554]|uniref:LCP family glycopolymer transferase n=1 Tax=Solibacillus sp. FSL K6-1554 TaxID=2921472 RepID=UPI0030F7C669
MKNVWKWLISIVLVLCGGSLILLVKVYGDIKSTADEIYTPIGERVPDIRTEPVDITVKKEPISALILGVDERDSDGGRSDTMIVLTVNPSLETTKMISIPRDTYTEIIGKGFKDKINHAYSFGGMEMAVKTVENLLNIPIDYVVKVNMESFVDIIDIIGGITVLNTFAFNYDGENFPTGELEMDGDKSLKYVRMRYDDPSGDFGRQNRQKQVIQGVIQESLSLNTVWNYKSIFKAIEKNIELNVVFEDFLRIRKNYGDSLKQIEQLYITNGSSMMKNQIYYYLPNESELQDIQQNLQEHMEI